MGKGNRIDPEQLFFVALFLFMFGMTIYRNSVNDEVKNNEAQMKTPQNDSTNILHTDTVDRS
jgi:hypothetical protein